MSIYTENRASEVRFPAGHLSRPVEEISARVTGGGGMRRVAIATLLALFVGVGVAAYAAPPVGAHLAWSGETSLSWRGGPVTGPPASVTEAPCTSPGLDCDQFKITVDAGAADWAARPGGVVFRIAWSNLDQNVSLAVRDAQNRVVALSTWGARGFQQVYVPRASGEYVIQAYADGAANAAYNGRAWLVHTSSRLANVASGAMRFSQSLVDAQQLAFEPTMNVDREGDVLVTAPMGQVGSWVWRSGDDGRTFDLLDNPLAGTLRTPRRTACADAGGADADVTEDRTGRLYFVDAEVAQLAAAYSSDNGNTWKCNPAAASTIEVDRPWLAAAPTADGTGPAIDAYLSYVDLLSGQVAGGREAKPVQVHVDVTTDGGQSWKAASSFGAGMVPVGGSLFTAQDGTVYLTLQANNGVWLARSTDGAKSFRLFRVSQRLADPGNVWVTGAVDNAGTVYVSWVDAGTYSVFYSYSTDRGSSWSRPAQVNPPGTTAMLPAIAAGRAGDLAIAWYGTPGTLVPDYAPDSAKWNVWTVRSLNADSRRASFTLSRLSSTPVLRGPMATALNGAHNGRLFDEFDIGIAPSGALMATFNDNGRIADTSQLIGGVTDPGLSSVGVPYVAFAREIAGYGMERPEPSRAHGGERLGDARFPTRTGSNIRQLDFSAAPSASLRTPTTARITFPVASASKLTDALRAADGGNASTATWLVVWRTPTRLEYVGMQVAGDGKPAFLGGLGPVGLFDPAKGLEGMVDYPAAIGLHGRVNAKTGTVTIQLPLAAFHLAVGSRLFGLQAVSMTGQLPEHSVYTMPLVIDSTPARNFRLN